MNKVHRNGRTSCVQAFKGVEVYVASHTYKHRWASGQLDK